MGVRIGWKDRCCWAFTLSRPDHQCVRWWDLFTTDLTPSTTRISSPSGDIYNILSLLLQSSFIVSAFFALHIFNGFIRTYRCSFPAFDHYNTALLSHYLPSPINRPSFLQF